LFYSQIFLSKLVFLSVRWLKNSSFGFLALALCVGKNQMCLTERRLFTLSDNGWQLGEVADFEALTFILARKFF